MIPSRRPDPRIAALDSTSAWIISNFRPTSALCVGKGVEALADSLRHCGVSIQMFDMGAPLDRRFDVVICFAPLSELQPDRIALLARSSDCLVCGIAPEDLNVLTEPDVQLSEHFVPELAQHDFYRDLTSDVSLFEQPVICLRKLESSAQSAVVAYDRRLLQLEREAVARRYVAIEYREEKERLERDIDRLHQQLAILQQTRSLQPSSFGPVAGEVSNPTSVAIASDLLTIEQRLAPANSERVRVFRWMLRKFHAAGQLTLRSFDIRDKLLDGGRKMFRGRTHNPGQ